MSLERFLREKNIWHRFLDKRETVHTADAADVTGISLNRITKNLVSITDTGECVLLVVQGDRRVNLKKAAKALRVKNVSVLPFGEAQAISGYPPGGTPTVGHRTKMIVVLDRLLLEMNTIFCGGGTRDKLLELRTEDIVKIIGVIIADISEDSQGVP